MSSELKPCPFCGGEVEIDDSEMFTCDDCGMIARFPKSPRQMKNAKHGLVINNYDIEWHTSRWNTRAERTCKPIDEYFCGVPSCGNCGVTLNMDTSGVRPFNKVLPNYCSSCGAKVVD